MPTYGDETSRGFYLRDGGYYFAINDKMDRSDSSRRGVDIYSYPAARTFTFGLNLTF